MKISSVNLGSAEEMEHRGKILTTGISKHSDPGTVFVAAAGLLGDTVCDLEEHGGPDQAVYVYSADDYQWWSDKLGRVIVPGTFGDNLTIAGFPSDLQVGDRLLVRELILEATMPRIPCGTLAAKMQDSNFGLAYRRAERPGIYFRVLNEGEVAAGDAVILVPNPEPGVSILELYRLHYDLHPDPIAMRKMLLAPIAVRMRARIETLLAVAERGDYQ